MNEPYFCSSCGHEVDDGAMFCAYCGAPITIISDSSAKDSSPQPKSIDDPAETICPKCGKRIPKGSKFCPLCRAQLIVECPKCGLLYSAEYSNCNACGTNREAYLKEQEQIERQKKFEEETREKERLEQEQKERDRKSDIRVMDQACVSDALMYLGPEGIRKIQNKFIRNENVRVLFFSIGFMGVLIGIGGAILSAVNGNDSGLVTSIVIAIIGFISFLISGNAKKNRDDVVYHTLGIIEGFRNKNFGYTDADGYLQRNPNFFNHLFS